MSRFRRVVMLALTAPLLISCGGDGSYDDLLELRDAAIDAGLACDEWERTSAETGSCSDSSVIYLYDSETQRRKEMDDLARKLEVLPMDWAILVNDNWAINSTDAGDLQDDLGGELLSSSG